MTNAEKAVIGRYNGPTHKRRIGTYFYCAIPTFCDVNLRTTPDSLDNNPGNTRRFGEIGFAIIFKTQSIIKHDAICVPLTVGRDRSIFTLFWRNANVGSITFTVSSEVTAQKRLRRDFDGSLSARKRTDPSRMKAGWRVNVADKSVHRRRTPLVRTLRTRSFFRAELSLGPGYLEKGFSENKRNYF